MEPSLSSSSAISQHAEPVVVRQKACVQQQPVYVHPRGHSHVAMDQATPGADASGAAGPKHGEGLKKLTAALAKVLSSGLASNFVEGLKPIVHNGELLISTHIKLASDPQPVFIGMFPSLPAAVAAQTQTSELVGHLPAEVARKLIAQQLAHTAVATSTAATACGAAAERSTGPERWQSNTTTSDSTAVGIDSPSPGGAGTLRIAKQQVQEGHPGTPQAEAGQHSPTKQQRDTGSAAAHTAAAVHSITAAAGGHIPSCLPSTASGLSGAVTPSSPCTAPGVTDDVLRVLLHKGLHALTVAQQQQQQQHFQQLNRTGSAWQEQEQELSQQQAEASLRDLFNTPVGTPQSLQRGGTLTQLHSPLHSSVQQQQQQSILQQLGPGTTADMDGRSLLSHLGNVKGDLHPGLHASTGQQYSTHMGQASSQATAAAAGGLLSDDAGLALDGALHEAMLRGMTGPWAPPAAPYSQPAAGGVYAELAAGCSAAGLSVRPEQGLGMLSIMQQQQQQQQQALTYGDPRPAGVGVAAGCAGGYGSQQRAEALAAHQYGHGGPYGGAFDPASGQAAAAAGFGGGSGVGDKRGRPAVDPRVHCVKSVQYRVSRFPSELHDLCIEHWEQARCARVVCNAVQGVMSVQSGRCVVTFHQSNQEVVKGVADYLRYAGEERIKKWRRHVRMVDFPRPGNRSGELMTAEEFLCIVGYQSEQGGGKRARADWD